MATRQTPPVTIFSGGDDGYGDAVAAGRNAYAWTFNGDCRAFGRAVPSIVPTGIGIKLDAIPRGIGAAFEWEDSSGRPIILLAGASLVSGTMQRSVAKIQDGAFSIEDNQSGAAYTGGVLYRHDGSDADAETAYFCNGDDQDVLMQRTKAGVYSAAGHDIKADGLAVISGDLWLWQGYKIAKCTWNADPGLDASYPTKIPCGRPTWPINEVHDLGGSPLVFKGDGVWRYNPNPSVADFENMTPFVPAHKDNGKGGGVDGRGRVYYPTVDGQVQVLSFGFQTQQRPLLHRSIDRDSPFGRISAISAGSEHIYGAIEPGGVRVQKGLGLKVKVYDASLDQYIDWTEDVTNQQHQRVMSLGSIGATRDRIYIGADEPVWGAFMEIATANTGVTLPLSSAAGD